MFFVTKNNIIAIYKTKKYNIYMKKSLLILGIVFLVVLFERMLSMTALINQLELITFDTRAKIATDKGPFNKKFKHADKNIVIVSIDDYSRKELASNPQIDLGSFPWPRNVWAGVVNFIEKGHPKAILFDLIFNDLNENPDNDKTFANELRKHNNVVLATSLNDPKFLVDTLPKGSKIANSNYSPTPSPLNVDNQDRNIDYAISFYSHAPVHNLYTNHTTMGVVNKVVDADSVIRNSQPVFKLIKNGKTYYLPSLSFAGFLKYIGEGGKITIKDNKIFYKDRIISINEKGESIISWHGLGHDYDYIPISKVLLSEKGSKFIDPRYFKDKIVIIGRTEAGTDIHSSAVNPSYAGPESNATAIDNFINDSNLDGKNIRKPISKMSTISAFFITVFACIFIALIGIISKNALICFINSIGFIILYLIFSVWIYANPSLRIWIPVVIPMYYLIMTGSIVFAYRFQKELAKKATIMNMFGKFVSPKVLTTLMKDQDNLVLKSTKKRITVMFCDVKSFTTISEKSDPEQLVNDLNELFNVMVNIIFENNGTVDKFIGDCIMAYWGEPIAHEDDAYMAVKTALEIKQKVRELAEKNEKEGKIPFDVKMGINTGEALLGLAGSEKIMSYTAMGDAVNVASRLESNCSKLGRDLLISKSTYDDAKDKIKVLEAGKISVKGRDEQIEVYEPTGIISQENKEIL